MSENEMSNAVVFYDTSADPDDQPARLSVIPGYYEGVYLEVEEAYTVSIYLDSKQCSELARLLCLHTERKDRN